MALEILDSAIHFGFHLKRQHYIIKFLNAIMFPLPMSILCIFLMSFIYLQEELEKCDAFVVVYSVVDKASFTQAEQLFSMLMDSELIRTRPVILVANKIDLARSRAVSSQGKQYKWPKIFYPLNNILITIWEFKIAQNRNKSWNILNQLYKYI